MPPKMSSCFTVEGELVGFFGAPDTPFPWLEFLTIYGDPASASSSMQPAHVSLNMIAGSTPKFSNQALTETALVSVEMIDLFDKYGIAFTTELSEQVFAYEPESAFAMLQKFRFIHTDSLDDVCVAFVKFMHVWIDVNSRNMNPSLDKFEVLIVRSLYKNYQDYSAERRFESAVWDKGLKDLLTYMLVVPSKRRIVKPDAKREMLMELYGLHHVW